jgi:prevent-host-death family protein
VTKRWQLQEAKNRLSEVVDLALQEGPQTVTRHGKEVVVIVDKQEFERRRRSRRARGTIVPFLRGLAFRATRIALERSKDVDRHLDLETSVTPRE